MKRLRVIAILSLILVLVGPVLLPYPAALADDGIADGDDGGEEEDNYNCDFFDFSDGFWKHPTDCILTDVERKLNDWSNGLAETVVEILEQAAPSVTLTNPSFKSPSEMDIFEPAWMSTRWIGVALGAAALAILAAVASKDVALGQSFGIASLKNAGAVWLGGMLLAWFSLDGLDLMNRLANAITLWLTGPGQGTDALSAMALDVVALQLDPDLFVGYDPGLIVQACIKGLLLVLSIVAVLGLIGQHYARIGMLFVLVALAPVVLVLSILSPARWLRFMWLKGVMFVLLLGPVSALLLKLRAVAWDTFQEQLFVQFFVELAVISLLLTITGMVVKGVFGAAISAIGQLASAAAGVVTGGLAVGGAVLTGGASLGVLPATAGVVGPLLTGGSGALKGLTGTKGGSDGGTDAAKQVTSGGGPGGSGKPKPPGKSSAGTSQQSAGADDSGNGKSQGYWSRFRGAWRGASGQEKAKAVGTGLRTAGSIMGGRSTVGRAMSGIGGGLATGADAMESKTRAAAGSAGGASGVDGPPMTSADVDGYREGMDKFFQDSTYGDLRRGRRGGPSAAAMKSGAMAPAFAAVADGATMGQVASAAGHVFQAGNPLDHKRAVGDFVFGQMEGRMRYYGYLPSPVVKPATWSQEPLAGGMTWEDYHAGGDIADKTLGPGVGRGLWQEMAAWTSGYGRVYSAFRSHAGAEAAQDFYAAATGQSDAGGVARVAQEMSGRHESKALTQALDAALGKLGVG